MFRVESVLNIDLGLSNQVISTDHIVIIHSHRQHVLHRDDRFKIKYSEKEKVKSMLCYFVILDTRSGFKDTNRLYGPVVFGKLNFRCDLKKFAWYLVSNLDNSEVKAFLFFSERI